MKQFSVFVFLFVFVFVDNIRANEQPSMRDLFISAPDSIFPLLTKNNKLDCIDFIENNVEAAVKDKLEGKVMLTALTPDYLCIATSAHSVVMIKSLNPSNLSNLSQGAIVVCRTYLGPSMDSDVRVYDMEWRYIKTMPRPAVSDFLKPGAPEDLRMELEMLPLMLASLRAEDNTLTWELQATELSRETKKVASEYLQPVIVHL